MVRITELNNLAWVEFQTGHTDGTTIVMYIEITGQKTDSTKSQSCNSNEDKLHDNITFTFKTVTNKNDTIKALKHNYLLRWNALNSKAYIVSKEDIYNNLSSVRFKTFLDITHMSNIKRIYDEIGCELYQLIS